jgi:pentatricopeptide repeat protein
MLPNSPSPGSQAEVDKLIGLVRSIPSFSRMSQDEQDDLVDELLDYECYAQATRLLEWRLQSLDQSANQRLSDFCRLMDIQCNGLEDFAGFLAVAKRCVHTLALPFSTIRLQIVDAILGPENFASHAALLRALSSVVADRAQRVLLLSRLALITEKKLFGEGEVEPIFKEILGLDPLNIRALRFYRMWHIQGGEWRSAAGHLQTLIKAYRNPHEQQRAAHELAQIYLYSLNQPEKARQILLAHCSDSHLDTRQTLVEALERLGSYDELLDCLDDMRERSHTPQETASIILKRGQTLLKLERYEEAERSLLECLNHDSANLLVHEALLSAQIGAHHPRGIAETLDRMVKVSANESNRQRLQGLALSIRDLFKGHPPERFEMTS